MVSATSSSKAARPSGQTAISSFFKKGAPPAKAKAKAKPAAAAAAAVKKPAARSKRANPRKAASSSGDSLSASSSPEDQPTRARRHKRQVAATPSTLPLTTSAVQARKLNDPTEQDSPSSESSDSTAPLKEGSSPESEQSEQDRFAGDDAVQQQLVMSDGGGEQPGYRARALLCRAPSCARVLRAAGGLLLLCVTWSTPGRADGGRGRIYGRRRARAVRLT